jgi:hypothetical protein
MMTEGWFAITGKHRNDGANIGGAVLRPQTVGDAEERETVRLRL